MNYLFFDLECAYGKGGICEFGYILTDENFNTLKADNMLINPHIKFDDYGHQKAGIVFAYTKDEYYSSPDIMDRYEDIRQLLCNPDNAVIGFSTDSDAKFLINDLDRFDLPYLNFRFWDVLKMYRVIGQRTTNTKLDVLYSEACTQPLMHHEALSDTKMTIAVLQKLLNDSNITLNEVFEKYVETSGEVFNGRIIFNDGSVFNYTKGGRTTVANRKILDDFMKNCPISTLSTKFRNKIISVAPNIVKEDFAVTLALCYYASQLGARFTLSVCDAHYLLVNGETRLPRQRLRRGVKLLNREDMEKLLDLAPNTLVDENISVDELLGALPENEEWYKEYKIAHGKI